MNQVLKNLFTLLGAVQAQPEANFDLSSYARKEPCGTLFCTAGLAASLPHFQSQGMALIPWSTNTFMVEINGLDIDVREADTDKMFGPDAWYSLFATYADGRRDESLGSGSYGSGRAMTDKALAIARIQAQIAAVEQGE
jgi:hypothetical protein